MVNCRCWVRGSARDGLHDGAGKVRCCRHAWKNLVAAFIVEIVGTRVDENCVLGEDEGENWKRELGVDWKSEWIDG